MDRSAEELTAVEARPHGVPSLRTPDWALLRTALRKGWEDFRLAPELGLLFGTIYAAVGLLVVWVTWVTGQTAWMVLAAAGFPLVGPFAAVGLYELSHRLEEGLPIDRRAIFAVVLRQRSRQLPWLCAIIMILLLFWFFLGHMIFALFLGLSAMTNVSTSLEIFTTVAGASMLMVGTLVGAALATVLYSFSVLSLPLLLDRELDFVTAMLTSIAVVRIAPSVMLAWGLVLGVLVFLAMLPAFLGLIVVFPWLAHASWHVYSLMRVRGPSR